MSRPDKFLLVWVGALTAVYTYGLTVSVKEGHCGMAAFLGAVLSACVILLAWRVLRTEKRK